MLNANSGPMKKQELAEFWALIRWQGHSLSTSPFTGYINGDKYTWRHEHTWRQIYLANKEASLIVSFAAHFIFKTIF